MVRLRIVCLLALGAGLVAACSKPAGKPAAPAAAAAPGGDIVIGQAQLPHPRAGAWDMVQAVEGQAVHSRICVTDRPLNFGRSRQLCQTFAFHRTPAGAFVVDSACGRNGAASTMHLVAQGDFQAAYSTDMQMTFTIRSGLPAQAMSAHADYRYLGPCTASEEVDAVRAMAGGPGG